MFRFIILSVVSVLAWTQDIATTTTDGSEASVKTAGIKDDCQCDPAVSKDPVVYDAYFGVPLTTKRKKFLNGSLLCTVDVQPCHKYEGRRVDGTCTNPKYPSLGATLTPVPRLLPAQYGPGNTLRSATNGSELPSARLLRTTLLADGYFRDHDFSILATHIFVFSIVDSVDLFYLLRYVLGSTCCINQEPNPAGPFCIPISVPADDPYLRSTDVRCQNLTRVETYQDFGCLPPTLPAERYNRVTPLLDLSVVYGYTEERNKQIRLNQGGLLAFRMEGTREVPAGNSAFCLNNQPPESSCYNFGDDFHGNLLTGNCLSTMWFFREHNRIARELAIINPCWDDEKLFQIARQINIAQWQHIFYYELIAELLGYENALADGIIYDTQGHVNDFDSCYEPGVYWEYVVGCRWFHTFQPALFDIYRNGKYYGSRTTVDDELRSGIMALNNTEADMTQGAIRQPAELFDMVIDPDLVERAFGAFQRSSDLVAIDFMRGRDAGLPSYNQYRKLCGLKVAKTFEDFRDTIDKDKVEKIRRLYGDVDDVELTVAIHLERLLPGAFVGPTLYCIMAKNLLLWRKSDRFFFEHGDTPASLTKKQLYEVRQSSMARVLCNSGDDVVEIQPRALLRKGPWNDFVSCNKIPGMDLNKWKDPKCYCNI